MTDFHPCVVTHSHQIEVALAAFGIVMAIYGIAMHVSIERSKRRHDMPLADTSIEIGAAAEVRP